MRSSDGPDRSRGRSDFHGGERVSVGLRVPRENPIPTSLINVPLLPGDVRTENKSFSLYTTVNTVDVPAGRLPSLFLCLIRVNSHSTASGLIRNSEQTNPVKSESPSCVSDSVSALKHLLTTKLATASRRRPLIVHSDRVVALRLSAMSDNRVPEEVEQYVRTGEGGRAT